MIIKNTANNVSRIKNNNRLKLESKKGVILKILAYMLLKPESITEKSTLEFKIIGSIKEINSDTNYKVNDIVMTSEKNASSYKCIYAELKNLSECFYYDEEKIFPEGFYQEIFVPDMVLETDYKKTFYDFIENETILKPFEIYPLYKTKLALENIFSSNINCAFLSAHLFSNAIPLNLSNNNFNKTEWYTKELTLNSGETISVDVVQSYKTSNIENKRILLETDEEFDRLCSEVYEIKNSKFCLPLKDSDVIQRIIYNSKNYWDIGMLSEIDNILKDNSIILDIGSNIGNHSLYWANERNAKKIYAFEPFPYSYKILEKNVKNNHLEDVINIYPFGIFDQETKCSITSFCKTNIGGTNFRKDENGKFDYKTLDSLNIQDKIDLIKIDVEGVEIEALNGGIETIKKNLPIIVIETFQKRDMVENILLPLGYKFYKSMNNNSDYIYLCEK